MSMNQSTVAFPVQKRYAEKKRESGQRRVGIWVPLDRVDELKEIARKMRDDAARAAVYATHAKAS